MAERSPRSQKAIEELLQNLDKSPGASQETTPGPTAPPSAGVRRAPQPESPWGLVFAGAFLSLVGAVGLVVGEDLVAFGGAILIGLGSIVTLVGIVAAGVRLGMRWARYDRGE
jgi:hypothetical protein